MRTGRAGPIHGRTFQSFCGDIVDECPPHRVRRARARAGLGDLGEPAARQPSTARPAMPASPRWPSASTSTSPTMPPSSRFCREQRHRRGRDRPRGAAGGGPRRRSRRGQDQGVRPLQGRRPARGLEGLHQGPLPRVLASRPAPTAASRDARSAKAYLASAEAPDRHQGRRPGRRQGRGHRRDEAAGGGRRRRLLRRRVRGGRRRDRHRGVPRGRGGERLCPRRRQQRAPARQRPGPQARRRRRHRPQHRRHGRLLAGPRHDARDDGAGDGRDHPPDRARAWPRAAHPTRACCSSAS